MHSSTVLLVLPLISFVAAGPLRPVVDYQALFPRYSGPATNEPSTPSYSQSVQSQHSASQSTPPLPSYTPSQTLVTSQSALRPTSAASQSFLPSGGINSFVPLTPIVSSSVQSGAVYTDVSGKPIATQDPSTKVTTAYQSQSSPSGVVSSSAPISQSKTAVSSPSTLQSLSTLSSSSSSFGAATFTAGPQPAFTNTAISSSAPVPTSSSVVTRSFATQASTGLSVSSGLPSTTTPFDRSTQPTSTTGLSIASSSSSAVSLTASYGGAVGTPSGTRGQSSPHTDSSSQPTDMPSSTIKISSSYLDPLSLATSAADSLSDAPHTTRIMSQSTGASTTASVSTRATKTFSDPGYISATNILSQSDDVPETTFSTSPRAKTDAPSLTKATGFSLTSSAATQSVTASASTIPSRTGTNQPTAATDLNESYSTLTPSTPCSQNGATGGFACVGEQLAKCGSDGKYKIVGCAAGSQCYALPLADGSGTTVQCDTPEDARKKLGTASSTAGESITSVATAIPSSRASFIQISSASSSLSTFADSPTRSAPSKATSSQSIITLGTSPTGVLTVSSSKQPAAIPTSHFSFQPLASSVSSISVSVSTVTYIPGASSVATQPRSSAAAGAQPTQSYAPVPYPLPASGSTRKSTQTTFMTAIVAPSAPLAPSPTPTFPAGGISLVPISMPTKAASVYAANKETVTVTETTTMWKTMTIAH